MTGSRGETGSAMHLVKETLLSDHPGATPGVTLPTPETLTTETEAPSQWGSSSEARGAPPDSLHSPHSVSDIFLNSLEQN